MLTPLPRSFAANPQLPRELPYAGFPRRINLFDASAPARVANYKDRVDSIEVVGGPLEATRVVAIVGSREATPDAQAYAFKLAAKLAERGVVVASGGATGIDRAAHEGALSVGGETWAVIPAGYPHVYPLDHKPMYQTIAERGGTLIWALEPNRVAFRGGFGRRNQLLVMCSDAVVVVQASVKSGSRISARWAREMKTPLWVVPPAPWFDARLFGGNVLELAHPTSPARALYDDDALFKSLQLDRPSSDGRLTLSLPFVDAAASNETDEPARDDAAELAILRALRDAHDGGAAWIHTDEIALRSALTPQQVSTALLTLSLEALVLEGPPGFYRRQAIARPELRRLIQPGRTAVR